MSLFQASGKYKKDKGEHKVNIELKKKGWFERLAEQQKSFCSYCKRIDIRAVAICDKCSTPLFWFWKQGRGYLCKDCAKKCKKCGKYFCPKHIKNHKCR